VEKSADSERKFEGRDVVSAFEKADCLRVHTHISRQLRSGPTSSARWRGDDLHRREVGRILALDFHGTSHPHLPISAHIRAPVERLTLRQKSSSRPSVATHACRFAGLVAITKKRQWPDSHQHVGIQVIQLGASQPVGGCTRG
jgi:hypothetical protein